MSTAREKIVNEINSLDDKDIYRVAKEVIGEYLLDMLPSPEIEEKILQEGKTLAGAMKAMEKKARESHSVCIPPDKGFQIVREYFGITEKKSITSDVDDLFA